MGRLDHTLLLERGPLWLPYLPTGQNNVSVGLPFGMMKILETKSGDGSTPL